MDERRDLVDREELRAALLRGGFTPRGEVASILDALPAVECPRGWTRDEVLAELDADPDAGWKRLEPYSNEWMRLTRLNVEGWHPEVRRYDVRVVRVAPEPEWVPVFEAVRDQRVATSPGVGDFVIANVGRSSDGKILALSAGGGAYVHVRDDGQVAVRPKAAS
jgi:hypothetical protein